MTTTLRDALRLARASELAMQAVYDDIAQLTEDGDPALVDLWQRMSLVEAHHAEILEQISADLEPGTAATPVAVDGALLERMVNRVLAFRERLSHTAVPIEEIFDFALDMEVHEQSGVLLQILDQTDNRLGDELRADIASPLSPHIAPLLDAIERGTDDGALRARVQALRGSSSTVR